LKLAVRGGGGLVTVRDFCELAVCCDELLSFAVRTTVKVPAVEYAWPTVGPVAVDPSPKFQE
jgi:hypothetical protein